MKVEHAHMVKMQEEYKAAWDDLREAEVRFKSARIAYKTVIMLVLAKYKVFSWCLFCIPSRSGSEDDTDTPLNEIEMARRGYRLAWIALQKAKASHGCALERRNAAFAMSPDIIYTLRCGYIGVSVHFLTAEARGNAHDTIFSVAGSEAVFERLRVSIYEKTFRESVIDPARIVDLHMPPMPMNEKAFARILSQAEELKKSS